MTDEDTPYDVTRCRLLRTSGVIGIAGRVVFAVGFDCHHQCAARESLRDELAEYRTEIVTRLVQTVRSSRSLTGTVSAVPSGREHPESVGVDPSGNHPARAIFALAVGDNLFRGSVDRLFSSGR